MTDMPGQEQPMETKKKNNTTIIIIVALAALALLLGCCLTVAIVSFARVSYMGTRASEWMERVGPWEDVALGGPRVKASRTAEKVFTVGEGPITLEIDNQIGSIEVSRGQSDQVAVMAEISAWANTRSDAEAYLDRVKIDILQTGPSDFGLVAKFSPASPFNQSPTVDWIVAVPRNTTVDITSDVGEISVEDVVGKANIHSDVGDVQLRGFEGAASIVSDVGDVTVEGWVITGDSRITTSVGSIRIVMASGSAFILSAETDVGHIVSDFRTAQERDKYLGPGDSLKGPVGTNPSVKLFVKTDTGSITLSEKR